MALYATSNSFNLKGFRLAIILGPRNITTYKYATTNATVGNGLSINGQSLTLGSENKEEKNGSERSMTRRNRSIIDV